MAKLTFEEASYAFFYDAKLGQLIWQNPTSNRVRKGDSVGSPAYPNGVPYLYVSLNKKKVANHQVIWLLCTGYWPTDQIDHIDGNSLNNRIENLRESSQAENTRNQKRHQHNSTGVTGVGRYKNKWRAYIGRDATHLGYFNTKEEAIAARIAAEKALGFTETHGKRV